jgi:hypothetical protein
MRLFRRLAVTVAATAALGSGCSETTNLAGPVPTSLHISANLAGTAVATVVVEVTAADIPTPLVFNIPITAGVASGSITVPAGSGRTINLRAYDDGGVLTHTGSWTGNVVGGTNPTVSLVLVAGIGDVAIEVTLGSVSVEVTPPSAGVAVAATVQLSAAVEDAEGNPIGSAVPKWATANPAVATVSTTGLVTGQGAGTTTIHATYQGAVGISTITVTAP